MTAARLYRKNVYQKECRSRITEIRPWNGKKKILAVCLEQTVFCPEGGGQSGDFGFLTASDGRVRNVLDSQEEGGEVLHLMEEKEAEGLETGMEVDCRIDWDHRFDNMQRHLGEHILSGAFFRLFGGSNHGFHMGEGGIVIDIGFGDPEDTVNPEVTENYDRVTWRMARQAEMEANRVIWENAPVRVDYFETFQEASQMPLRKKLNFEEDISVVTVGDPACPEDCCPCCGTHPSSAGQVGLIRIYKIEPNRGMSRIYCEAGRRALVRAQADTDLVYDIGTELSAGEDDLMKKFHARMKKADQQKEELDRLRRIRTENETENIRAALMKAGRETILLRFADLTPDDLNRVMKKAGPAVGEGQLLVLISDSQRAALLASSGNPGSVHCGRIVKEIGQAHGGRGGGRAGSAQVRFPDAASLDQFIDDISSEDACLPYA